MSYYTTETEFSEINLDLSVFCHVTENGYTASCSKSWMDLVIDCESETVESITALIEDALKESTGDIIETQTNEVKIIEALTAAGFEQYGYNWLKPEEESKFRFWLCDQEDLEWRRN